MNDKTDWLIIELTISSSPWSHAHQHHIFHTLLNLKPQKDWSCLLCKPDFPYRNLTCGEWRGQRHILAGETLSGWSQSWTHNSRAWWISHKRSLSKLHLQLNRLLTVDCETGGVCSDPGGLSNGPRTTSCWGQCWRKTQQRNWKLMLN